MGAAVVSLISDMQENSFSIPLTYIDALYYMIITSATVGYGDIFPQTLLARSVIVLIIMCVFMVFGDNIGKISALMKKANFEDKYYHLKDHIVIIGTIKLKEILRILMTIIEIRGIDNIPMILIIGDKKLN